MWARRLIYTMLAMLPVMFTAAIAVGTRLTPMDWTTPEFGDKTNEALLAYVPLVRQTAEDVPASMHPDAEAVERVANVWLASRMPPLSAGNMPASGLDGPFYDVQRARQLMGMNLLRCAGQSASAGDKARAARFLGLALRVSEVAKYSSLNSMSTAAETQREAIRQINALAKDLDARSRAELASSVSAVTSRPETVAIASKNLLEATRELMSSAKAMKRYAAASMTSVSLTDGATTQPYDMTTDELTVLGLAESAEAATNELGARRAETLRLLGR